MMGDFLVLLSREDDLVQKIATFLEPEDLHNLELSCKQLREFLIRAQTWRRKLETDFPKSEFEDWETLKDEPASKLHIKCKRLYAEQEEEIAMLKWKKFCTSWMTIMTISSLYSFLHDHPDDEGLGDDDMLPNLLPS